MSWEKDNPLSSNKDFSEEAIYARYEKAATWCVTCSARIAFESVSDIPFLLAERKKLVTELMTYRNNKRGGSENDSTLEDRDGSGNAKA